MEAPESRRRGGVKGLLNVTCVSTALFFAYISYVCYNMTRVMNPMRGIVIEPGTPTLQPLWREGTRMTATCYIAASKTFYGEYLDRSHPKAARAPIVARAEGLMFDQTMTGHSFDLNISALSVGADESSPNVTMLTTKDWNALMANASMFFHVLLEAESPTDEEGQGGLWTLLGSVPLVKYGPKPKDRRLRKLLQGTGGSDDEGVGGGSSGSVETRETRGGSRATSAKGSYISFWKPEVAVRIVPDFTEYPHHYLPQTIQRAAEIVGLDKEGRPENKAWDRLVYKPIVHVDEIGLTSDKYVPLNKTLSSLPLKVTIEPMSLPRWQLMQTLEGSLQQQKESFGFQDSDVDDIRRLVSDTNVYLLAVTLLASTLHLLFEFLAFKSDVDFWRKNKSLRGLSVRALFMEVVFQTVILLSLVEEDASLLVTVPAGVGVLIQIWKVRRATGMRLGRKGLVFTRLEKADGAAAVEGENRPNGKVAALAIGAGAGKMSLTDDDDSGVVERVNGEGKKNGSRRANGGAEGKVVFGKAAETGNGGGGGGGGGVLGADQAVETMQYDRLAIVYLCLLLLPVVVGFSAKKLVMDKHAGWYSWALQSLTAFVYTFGFVLMTPQLYINYRLKSVAHLPWRFLCYRSLNTVIDDLFAFVIRMPTMHRLSCFRDDVVFVVYLYQRWIYPVDANRPQDRGA